MSSHNDPLNLLQMDKEMDNVIPFLAPNKINQMIDVALARPQLAPQKTFLTALKIVMGGLAIAASLVLWVSVFAPVMAPPTTVANVDLDEFNELAMLDTWDRY